MCTECRIPVVPKRSCIQTLYMSVALKSGCWYKRVSCRNWGFLYVSKVPQWQKQNSSRDLCGKILKSPLASLVKKSWWLASCLFTKNKNQWSLRSFSSWIILSSGGESNATQSIPRELLQQHSSDKWWSSSQIDHWLWSLVRVLYPHWRFPTD